MTCICSFYLVFLRKDVFIILSVQSKKFFFRANFNNFCVCLYSKNVLFCFYPLLKTFRRYYYILLFQLTILFVFEKEKIAVAYTYTTHTQGEEFIVLQVKFLLAI